MAPPRGGASKGFFGLADKDRYVTGTNRGLSFSCFGFSEIVLDALVDTAIEADHPAFSRGAFRDRHGRWVGSDGRLAATDERARGGR